MTFEINTDAMINVQQKSITDNKINNKIYISITINIILSLGYINLNT